MKLRKLVLLGVFLVIGAASLTAQTADQFYSGGRQAFTDSQWQAASSQFMRLIREYPEDPRADSAAYMGAVAYFNAGDWRSCIDLLQSFPRRYPDSAWNRRVAYWEGMARFEQQDWPGAAAAFERQVTVREEPAYRERALLYLGICRENQGDARRAETVYGTLAADGKDYDLVSRALFRIGQIRLADGRPSEALDTFLRLARDFPDSSSSSDIDFWLAQANRRMGRPEAALDGYRDFLATVYESPQRSAALLDAAYLAAAAGLDDEALAYLDLRDRERGRAPDDAAATVLRIRAGSYLKTGQLLEARGAYSAILGNPLDAADAQTAAFDLAQTWLGTRDVGSAVPYLMQAASGPDPAIAADALFLAGTIDLNAGDVRGAGTMEKFASRFREDSRREEALRYAVARRREEDQLREAFDDLTILVRDYPRSTWVPSYLYARAEISLELGNDTQALQDWSVLVEQYRDSDLVGEAYSGIGLVYSRRDEHIRAAGFYEKAAAAAGGLRGGENGRRAIYSAAAAYYNGGRIDEAIVRFSSLVQDPSSPWGGEAAYHLGDAYYDRGDYADSRRAYRIAADYGEGVRVFDSLYAIGWTWFRESNWNEARKAFLIAADAAQLPEQRSRSQYRAGLCLASAGDWSAALDQYDIALGGTTGPWLEEAYYQKAWAQLNLGREDEALRTAHEMAVKYPSSDLPADLPFRMGENAFAAADYAGAVRWYDRCAAEFPDSDAAIRAGLRAALAYRESGDPLSSASRYLSWIERHPSDAGVVAAIRSLADTLKETGNPDTAKEALERIRIALSPREELTYPLFLTWVRIAGIPEDSLEQLERISGEASQPPADRAEALLLTAHRHRMDGRYSRSRQIYEVLIRDIPGRIGAEAQEGLARSLADEGKKEQAAEAYLAVVYLFPDQTETGNRSLREAERLYRELGRNDEADRVRSRIR